MLFQPKLSKVVLHLPINYLYRSKHLIQALNIWHQISSFYSLITAMSSLPRLPLACLDYGPQFPTPYGYHPSLIVGIIFVTLFTSSTALHIWQIFQYRELWLTSFALGAMGESIGWLARAVAYRCPYSVKLYEMQLAALIMGE